MGACLLPYNPKEIIGEVLGRPAEKGFDPSKTDFRCPFIDQRCTKRSTSIPNTPYPVCSILRNVKNTVQQVCVCPKRFYSIDFLSDVIEYCWPTVTPPSNPHIAYEVKMTGFGNVDFVIADIDPKSDINEFISVELQAIDITGSVMTAYQALKDGCDLNERPTYGFNWSNVYKRYITQLIRKGYFHHHWKTKIVAVMQDVVYDYICNWAEFMRSSNVKGNTVNIIFMIYGFENDPNNPEAQQLVLKKVEGTSHANLQQAVLYKEAPSKLEFCEQIKHAINRSH